MSIFRTLWNRLQRSKRYREEFVATYARRAFPFQVRAIMKEREISQAALAADSGLTQGVISRASNPAYGKLTLNTIIRIVGGLDMGLIIRIVPFSRMVREYDHFTEAEMAAVDTFDEENRRLSADPSTQPVGSTSARAARLFEITAGGQLKATFKNDSTRPVNVAANNSGLGAVRYGGN